MKWFFFQILLADFLMDKNLTFFFSKTNKNKKKFLHEKHKNAWKTPPKPHGVLVKIPHPRGFSNSIPHPHGGWGWEPHGAPVGSPPPAQTLVSIHIRHGILKDILLETDAKYLHENWFYTKDHISKSIKSKNLNNI